MCSMKAKCLEVRVALIAKDSGLNEGQLREVLAMVGDGKSCEKDVRLVGSSTDKGRSRKERSDNLCWDYGKRNGRQR